MKIKGEVDNTGERGIGSKTPPTTHGGGLWIWCSRCRNGRKGKSKGVAKDQSAREGLESELK